MDYEKHARDFLASNRLEFRADFIDKRINSAWNDRVSRARYRCTIWDKARYLKITFWQSAIGTDTNTEPSPYDVLYCLAKQEPGTFAEFCSEYGYRQTELARARKVYKAVSEEWRDVREFFTDTELDGLREIA